MVKCANKTFYDCEKCQEITTNSGNEKDYRCQVCRYHYILSDDVCVYDNNFTRYSSNDYINIKFAFIRILYLYQIYSLFII